MTIDRSPCTGTCADCHGIHIVVPDDPTQELHLLRMSKRFVDRAKFSITLRLESPSSMYVRGTREHLIAQKPGIQAIAQSMGWQVHDCLNGVRQPRAG